jgi:hypothetical protein
MLQHESVCVLPTGSKRLGYYTPLRGSLELYTCDHVLTSQVIA